MNPEDDPNYSKGLAKCEDCGLYDLLYKGYCKPCFDQRGMKYESN